MTVCSNKKGFLMLRNGVIIVGALGLMAATPPEPTFLTGRGKLIRSPQPETGVAPATGERGKGLCVARRKIKAETAETESSLILHITDGRAIRVTLPRPCDGLLGLNAMAKLQFAGDDAWVCPGDQASLEGSSIGAVLGGATDPSSCRLGGFEAISEMSLTELLRR
jgi:hypothetical protein